MGFSGLSVRDYALAAANGLLLVLFIVLFIRGTPHTGEAHIIAETPAGISFECLNCNVTPDDIAKIADTHCRMFGKNAQRKNLNIEPSGDVRAAFVCL